VVVYWNDHNIEADAVVLTAQRPRRFLGLAKYVQPLSRFGATAEQLDAEAARKKARLHYSRSELRSIQPEMQRNRNFTTDATDKTDKTNRIGAEIAAASSRAE